MSINVYEEVVVQGSENEDEMTENGDQQESSDTDGFFGDNIAVDHEQIAVMTTRNVNTPKKQGRPTKDEVERRRMAALYHGTYNSYSNNSNGTMETPGSQKRRGRPPKSDSEKNKQPKSAIRIALGPKASKIQRTETMLPNDEVSPFPLVHQADATRKSRGRPRIHPPKDNSVKRPRGRPRIVPLEGEAALRNAYLKLKRDCAKKDLIIKKLRERLEEFGHSVDDIMQEQSKIFSEQNDSEEHHGDENESYEGSQMTLEPSSMEDTHQKYIGLFAETEVESKEETDSESE